MSAAEELEDALGKIVAQVRVLMHVVLSACWARHLCTCSPFQIFCSPIRSHYLWLRLGCVA